MKRPNYDGPKENDYASEYDQKLGHKKSSGKHTPAHDNVLHGEAPEYKNDNATMTKARG
jgi:hypothetical protein